MRFLSLPLVLLLGLIWGCSPEPSGSGASSESVRLPGAQSQYVEKGDISALKERGQLRILVHQYADQYLPRAGYPLDIEREMAQRFAREQEMEPVLVPVSNYGDLLTALLEGKGDVVAANLTVTESRAERASFTLGIDQTREVIVGRAGGPQANSVDALAGYSVGVMRDTSFWELAQSRLAENSGIDIVPLESSLTSDDVLDGLVKGEYDFALQDSNVMDIVRTYREDVETRFALGERRPLAWAVRPENPELLAELNRFLTRERLTRSEIDAHTDDLGGIRERKVLRVITRNNASTYYLYRGELVGFEYELAQRFADTLGVRLQMVVAESHEQMLPMLQEGEGDLVAAFLTRTAARSEAVAFSRAYHYATETVVGQADEEPLKSAANLAGRTLHLRRSSSYWDTAAALQNQGVEVTLEAVPDDMETEEIIDQVAQGEFDLTIADSHILQSELTWRDDVTGLLSLGEPISHSWAVRQNNPELLEAVDNFWDKEYPGAPLQYFLQTVL